MFDVGNIQYLLTLSDGTQINVFYSEGSGINLATTSMKKRWTPPKPIIKATLPYFSTSADEWDNIHIFHQDTRGDLVHLLYKNKQWDMAVVLKGKESAQYNKYPYIICRRDTAYLFYVLKHAGSLILSYQKVEEDGRISSPVALDYIDNAPLPYKLFSSDEGLFLAYCRNRDGKRQHIFRYYDFNSGVWKNSREIMADPVIYGLEAIAAHDNKVHICLKKKTGSTTALYDHVYDRDGARISNDTICEGQPGLSEAFIAVPQGRLVCFWSDMMKLRISYSFKDSSAWSRPKSINMYEGIPFNCFSLNGGEYDYYSQFGIIPGKYSDGIKLALIDKYSELRYRPADDSDRNSLVNSSTGNAGSAGGSAGSSDSTGSTGTHRSRDLRAQNDLNGSIAGCSLPTVRSSSSKNGGSGGSGGTGSSGSSGGLDDSGNAADFSDEDYSLESSECSVRKLSVPPGYSGQWGNQRSEAKPPAKTAAKYAPQVSEPAQPEQQPQISRDLEEIRKMLDDNTHELILIRAELEKLRSRLNKPLV